MVTAVYDLGAICGALSCIAYSDKIGRLRTILGGLILAIVALALEGSAYSIAQLIIGRSSNWYSERFNSSMANRMLNH